MENIFNILRCHNFTFAINLSFESNLFDCLYDNIFNELNEFTHDLNNALIINANG
jgi:hypothetical protein